MRYKLFIQVIFIVLFFNSSLIFSSEVDDKCLQINDESLCNKLKEFSRKCNNDEICVYDALGNEGYMIQEGGKVVEITVERVYQKSSCVQICLDNNLNLMKCRQQCKISLAEIRYFEKPEFCLDNCISGGIKLSVCEGICPEMNQLFMFYHAAFECVSINCRLLKSIEKNNCVEKCKDNISLETYVPLKSPSEPDFPDPPTERFPDDPIPNKDTTSSESSHESKSYETKNSIETEKKVDWTFEFWAMLGFIALIATALAGWYASRLHRHEAVMFLDQMENIFTQYRYQQDMCVVELQKLKTQLKEDFRRGKIDESNFDFILQKIESYLSQLEYYQR
jgi:hypothetical protein